MVKCRSLQKAPCQARATRATFEIACGTTFSENELSERQFNRAHQEGSIGIKIVLPLYKQPIKPYKVAMGMASGG